MIVAVEKKRQMESKGNHDGPGIDRRSQASVQACVVNLWGINNRHKQIYMKSGRTDSYSCSDETWCPDAGGLFIAESSGVMGGKAKRHAHLHDAIIRLLQEKGMLGHGDPPTQRKQLFDLFIQYLCFVRKWRESCAGKGRCGVKKWKNGRSRCPSGCCVNLWNVLLRNGATTWKGWHMPHLPPQWRPVGPHCHDLCQSFREGWGGGRPKTECFHNDWDVLWMNEFIYFNQQNRNYKKEEERYMWPKGFRLKLSRL